MKSPNKLLSSLIAGITIISAAHAQQYSASPVYTAPVIAADGQSATVSGSWSPVGITPINFEAVISLVYESSSVYGLKATQVDPDSEDFYSYELESFGSSTNGDVVTMNIDYINIDPSGAAADIVWDSDPAFTINHGFNNNETDYEAVITNVPVSELVIPNSVFNQHSTTFTISGSDPITEVGVPIGSTKGETRSDDNSKDDSEVQLEIPAPTFASDIIIFNSFKQGVPTWTATATSVPEPSSAILLSLGAGFLLRRRR